MRKLNELDDWITRLDRGLRAGAGTKTHASRPSPAANAKAVPLSPADRRRAIELMRVNHAGEVAAQALYEGQAATASDPRLRDTLLEAAREEVDHLQWCAARLDELGGNTSRLGPLWYFGSLIIGAAAGRTGDRWSLGFLAETENQVSTHLQGHLAALPPADERSRVVLEQMKDDEERHATTAVNNGAAELPGPVRGLMRLASKFMTVGARWV